MIILFTCEKFNENDYFIPRLLRSSRVFLRFYVSS